MNTDGFGWTDDLGREAGGTHGRMGGKDGNARAERGSGEAARVDGRKGRERTGGAAEW